MTDEIIAEIAGKVGGLETRVGDMKQSQEELINTVSSIKEGMIKINSNHEHRDTVLEGMCDQLESLTDHVQQLNGVDLKLSTIGLNIKDPDTQKKDLEHLNQIRERKEKVKINSGKIFIGTLITLLPMLLYAFITLIIPLI